MNKATQRFRKILRSYWDILFYVGVVLVMFLNWFDEGTIISGVDSNFPLTLNAIDRQIDDFKYLINNVGAGEIFNPFPYFTIFPYSYLLKFFGIVTGNILEIQKLYFFSFFIFSYLGVRLFLKEFLEVNSPMAFWIAGTMYAMNPVSDFLFTAYLTPVFLAYSLFPFVAHSLVASVKYRSKAYYLLFLILYQCFIFTLIVNPPHFLALNILGVGLLLCYPGANGFTKLKYIVVTGALFVLINCMDIYIILEYYKSFFSDQEGLFAEKPALAGLQGASTHSTVFNVFRLMHMTGFHDVFWPGGVAQYSRLFYSVEIIPQILSVAPIILIILGIWCYGVKHRFFLNLFLFMLIIIFFAKGLQPPFSDFFIFLFENFKPLQVMRSSPEKFGYCLAFLFSILMGVSYCAVKNRIKENLVPVFVIFLIATTLYSRLPWLNGDVITDDQGQMPSFYVNIPEYYKDLERDTQLEGYKTGINLPSFGRKYLWGLYDWGYVGINIMTQYIDNWTLWGPAINGSVRSQWLRDVASYNLGETVHTAHQEKFANLLPYLSLLGIQEVIVNMDREPKHVHYTTTEPMRIKKSIELKLGQYIKKKVTYGEGKIIRYILQDDIFPGDVYLPDRIFYSKENLQSEYGKISTLDSAQVPEGISPSASGSLQYIRETPSQYRVKLHIPEDSGLVVFNKEYNKKWRLVAPKGIHAEHFLVNTYANGWNLTSKIEGQPIGNVELVIKFTLQSVADLRDKIKMGLLSLGLVGCLVLFLLERPARLRDSCLISQDK